MIFKENKFPRKGSLRTGDINCDECQIKTTVHLFSKC